jgi:sigma-54 dependent transcriptional regulator, acetoin dehydrogenase operon transcriptional activator AcoR
MQIRALIVETMETKQADIHQGLQKAWNDFVCGRTVTGDPVRPEIMASWKRSRACGVDPHLKAFPLVLNDKQTKSLLIENSLLISSAQRVLKSFYHYIKNIDVVISLHNKEGYILDIMGEGPIWTYAEQVVNSRLGTSTHEKYVGTTAPFMAILHDQPFEMMAEEHYAQCLHLCMCVAASLHNERGEVIGALNMTASHEMASQHPHTLAMIAAVAKIIENDLQLANALEQTEFISQSLKDAMASMADGLIVLGRDDRVVHVNSMAEKLLGFQLEEIKDNEIVRIVKNSVIIEAVKNKRKLVDYELVLEESVNKHRYLVSVSPILSLVGKHIGTSLFFKEFKSVQNLIQRVVGQQAHYTFKDILGESPGIEEVKRVSRIVAKSSSNVIITGESGTGKEMVAQSIHNSSQFSKGPFIAINCAAMPSELIESEIFGYESGTFTGGLRSGKAGKLELAYGGTIFLDEINGMSMGMQVKLLRVLEERVFQRVGGNRSIDLQARIISATNQDLAERIQHDNFRPDLYYRLSVVEIQIPPLRQRIKDIEKLTYWFIEEKSRLLNKTIKGITDEALSLLLTYPWPGNVRELKNWIERAVNLAEEDYLKIIDFPNSAHTEAISAQRLLKHTIKPINEPGSLRQAEQEVIKATINECQGNILESSRHLGISRATLYRKMEKHQIAISRKVHS